MLLDKDLAELYGVEVKRLNERVRGTRVLLLLLDGDKSSHERDIARAREYWRDHQRSRVHG